MEQRLIDANTLQTLCDNAIKDRCGSKDAPVSWAEAYAKFKNDIDSMLTVYPENLRPVGWWRYSKKTRSWHCGRCGWKNPLMSSDGPSPDGEPFPYCMCCGAKMAGECYEIEKNHLKSIGSDIHK